MPWYNYAWLVPEPQEGCVPATGTAVLGCPGGFVPLMKVL